MTTANRTPTPNPPLGSLIGIAIALVTVGAFCAVRYFFDRQYYESAVQLYELSECGAANEQFNRVINAFRLVDLGDYASQAEQKKAECRIYLDAIAAQEREDFELALLNHAKLTVYEDSALLGLSRNQLHEFLLATDTPVASLPVCSQLEPLAERDMFPETSESVPLLYVECGKLYEAEEQHERAIASYETFLDQHSEHPLTGDVEQALAKATVADVRGSENVREIESPGRIDRTSDGSTVVEIQNLSPAKMSITFSGDTPKFGEVSSCESCKVHIREKPDSCSEEGPVEQFVLGPGEYDIAVRFKADDGNPVNPWAGTWSLEPGSRYGSCFFIIRDAEVSSE